jgi:pyridoxal phosphate enzyme (YggS family)
MKRSEALAANLAVLQAELKSTSTRLLVVSKTQSLEDIRSLYEAGQRDFGENRVQELEEKDAALSDLVDLRWHLIGHLQSNKIPKLNKIARLVSIHSVDDMDLMNKLIAGLKLPRPVGLFLQVNTSGEDEKSGFEDEVALSEALKKLSGVSFPAYLQGLMTMGTIRTEDVTGEAHRCFKALRDLRDRLCPRGELSMGMSGDYMIARDYASDWVRVGSKIFKVH